MYSYINTLSKNGTNNYVAVGVWCTLNRKRRVVCTKCLVLVKTLAWMLLRPLSPLLYRHRCGD